MKKRLPKKLSMLFACLGLLLLSLGGNAQALTGIKTVPGDYSSISAAVAALNANGVGAGGVTINVAAGHTETLTSTIVLTATGTQANPIVFQKSGTGSNPLVTAHVGTTDATGAIPDGIWALSGCDYVTIDGIDLMDPTTNTTAVTTMEYGFGLYKASGANGCQHNTIQNCTVTLNRINNGAWTFGHIGSIGITAFNSKYNAATIQLIVTAASGSNSYNKFYGNTIQNCNAGLAFNGFAAPAPFTLGDTLNDVGGSSLATGNTILNYGGATAAANPATAIYGKDQWGMNVSYNTVNSNNGLGVKHPNILRGIWLPASSTGASVTVKYNTITIKGGGTSHNLEGVNCAFGGGYATNNTVDVSHNTLTGCSYTTGTSGSVYLIYISGGIAKTTTVSNNVFSEDSTHCSSGSFAAVFCSASPIGGTVSMDNNTLNGMRMMTTGSVTYYGIYFIGAAVNSTVTIRSNTFDNITQTGAQTGSYSLINTSGGLTNGTYDISNNTFTNLSTSTTSANLYLIYNATTTCNANIYNNSIVGAFTRTGVSGTMYAYTNTGTPTSGTPGAIKVYNNNFSNIVAGGSNIIYGINLATSSIYVPLFVRKNTISNFSGGFTGQSYGINLNGTGRGSFVDSNTVSNITAAGAFYGINIGSAVANNDVYVANNDVSGLTTTAANQVMGIYINNGTTFTGYVYNNKIYNLSATHASGTAYGINVAPATSINTNVVTLFNNRISGITAPAAHLATGIPNQAVGINAPMSLGNLNIYNNTVQLSATSTGTNFGSSALSVNAGSTLDLRNNILVNLSTPNGTGKTVVFRRGNAALTTFATTSNNNILYAGDSTIAGHHIYNENASTVIDTLISAYRLRMTTGAPTREVNSQTENVAFMSTAGTDPNYLRVDTLAFSFVESNATRISTVSFDATGAARATFAGYTGNTGGLPDIGAVEGDYKGDVTKQMTYGFMDLKQDTGMVARGSVNNRVLRLVVNTQQTYNAMHVTRFKFNTAGTTADSDIVAARLYYTGADSVFNTSDLFGSTLTPSGEFYIDGNKALAEDTNFFWLAYDVNENAIEGNLLDAVGDSALIDGVNHDFLTANPVNARTIKAPLSGDYAVGVSGAYAFARITDALTALYTVGVSGPVRFILKDANYNLSTNEVFPLVLGNYGGRSAVNTITIMPDAGVSSVISNATATASPAIRFDNGQYFIIDGRQDATGGFVLGTNLSIVTSSTLYATIELRNESSNNIIRYTEVKGRNTNLVTIGLNTLGGVISFQTTTGANGNDNNTIFGCNIHPDGSVLPSCGIYSWGTGLTDAMNNDGNIVDSCDIYDYFLANNASAGVFVGLFNSTWQIVNNRFYQTTTRTWTTGNTNRAIWINAMSSTFSSSQSGFVVSYNQIGGNAPVLGGTYDLAPLGISHLFTAIDVSVGWGAASSIQGNTISRISVTSSSASQVATTLINMNNGNANCGNISGNHISNIVHTTNAASGGGITGIRGNSGGTYLIQNNTLSNITVAASAVTNSGEFIGINVLGSTATATIQNNMIGDTALTAVNSINNTCTAPASTFASRMYGILVNPNIGNPGMLVDGNYIANMNTTSLSASSNVMKGIVMNPSVNGIYNVTNNTVFNLTTSSRSISAGAGATLGGIVYDGSAYNALTISGNTIHSLTLVDTAATAAVKAVGLYVNSAASGDNIVKRNIVHSISKQSLNDAEVIYGIEIGGGNPVVVNNLVRLGLDSAGVSMTVPSTICGIVGTGGTSGVYHNTVYIGGTGVGASTKRTFAYMRTNTAADDVRNNIFVNQREPATPNTGNGHFAVSLSSNTNLNQNYNILYADSVGVFNGTAYETANNWKVASAVDANSLNSNPNLVNPNGDEFTLDLSIDTNLSTAIEAGGQIVTALGVDVDFNENDRSLLTPVDIGAYAGNYIPLDLAAPVISYTALKNTIATGDRIITATITDATGVFLDSALAPRIYFKKSALGIYSDKTGVKTAGTAQNGTWNFTIDSALLGGLMGDDSIYYFIVGQDSSSFANMGSTPGGVEGSNVGSINVYPALNSYKIIALISDTLEVGAGKTLPNLTGLTGAFNYINTSVLKGNVVLSVTSDIEEPGTIALNNWTETGAGNYTVHIIPNDSVVRNITSTYRLSPAVVTEAFIRLDRADRVTFNGNFEGAGRYLRFMNRDSLGTTINLLNDADGNTIANCILEGMNKASNVGIVNFYSTNVVGASGNDSNLVTGCLFRDTLGTGKTHPTAANKPYIGVYSQGSAVYGNEYNRVENSEFVNMRTSAVVISSTGGDYWTIHNNAIYSTNDSVFTLPTFISIQGGGGHMISNNSIGGTKATRDSVPYISYYYSNCYGIRNTSTSALPIYIDGNHFGSLYFPATGINFMAIQASGTGGARAYITNNVMGGSNIWDTINHVGTFIGIYVSQPAEISNNEVAGIYKRVYNSSGYSSGTYLGNQLGSVNLHDNSFHDIYHSTSSTGTGAQGAIGIFMLAGGTASDTIERNTVYNIGGINGGATTRGISLNTSSPNPLIVNANKIYNVFVTAPATTGALAIGIFTSSTPPLVNRISNNYINLGSSGTGRVIGFGQGTASAVATYNVLNNTIFINGTGDTSSYGMLMMQSGGVNAYNNIIYNKRTSSGTNRNLALGTWFTKLSNILPTVQHNLFITNDTAKLMEDAAPLTLLGWTGIDTLYTSAYNKNWATDTLHVPADSLFTDTSAINNLSIVTTNSHAWYANGKGKPLATVTGDFDNQSTIRSTAIANGATDIGADEFTPSSMPPVAHADKAPAAGDSTLFYFASRKIAQLNWDFVGNLPSVVNAYYYSGDEAPNQIPGRTALNAYWDFQTVDGMNYAATVTLMQDSANFGDLVNPSNLSVAHYDGTQWTKDSFTVVNNARGFFTSGVNMLGLGVYTGTDGNNNPLPVKLTIFTARVNNGDVIVDWKTASEMNNRGFEIERSLDGRSFESVGFVKGAVNSNTVLSYLYNDKAAFAKTATQVLYYRLKQVDMNGSFNYSYIARVSINSKEVNTVSAYPNPFSNEMQVSFTATAESKAQVRILNLQGMVVAEQTANASKGLNRIDIENLKSLQTGMYFVELKVNGETTVVKVVKN